MKKLNLIGLIIALTININAQWSPLVSNTTNDLFTIHFTSKDTGYLGGSYGYIRKTTDGKTWVDASNGLYKGKLYYEYIQSFCFTDANTGYAAGSTSSSGIIYKTINAGNSWSKLTLSNVKDLYSIYFVDKNIGYAVGWYGNIIKTTDAGLNWTSLKCGSTQNLYSVFFTSKDIGYAVGDSGRIIKTINGGTTWTLQISGTTSILESIYFTDANTGFVVGYSGVLLSTTNGGSSWNKRSMGSFNDLHSIHFPTKNIGYAVGDGWDSATIVKTTNGGTSWQFVSSSKLSDNKPFYSVHFVDANIGYVTGYSGILLKTTIGVYNELNECDNDPNIYIYPNPANNNINIENKNIQYNNYKITINSVHGQEVYSSIINKESIYSIDVSGISNGIYFLTLINNDNKINRKIIIQH